MGRRKLSETKKVNQENNFPSEVEKSLDELFEDGNGNGVTTTAQVKPQYKTPTAEKIKRDAKLKKEITEASKEIPQIFSPEQVMFVFDAYVAILSFGYSIVLKTEYKLIYDELQFPDDAKEMMAKPLAKICSKYAPSEWAGMQAEIELISMMGLFTVMSFSRAKSVAEKEQQRIVESQRKRNSPMAQPSEVKNIPVS